LNAGSARIDHVINSKLNLFGRYNYAFSDSSQRGPVFASTHVLSSTTSFSSPVQTFTTGLTALITPSIANELRANYSNQRVTGRSALDGFGGAVPLPDSLLFLPGYSLANVAFFFYIVGAGEYVQGLQGVDEQRQVNLIDNVSILRAGHQIKAGVDYRWLAPFTIPDSYGFLAEFSGMTAAPGGVFSGTALLVDTGASQSNALLCVIDSGVNV
jgi:hypothetical protein